jgi:hypothetical protein
MTLFQIEELASYWAQHPPLHLLVAAYLGVGKGEHTVLPPTSRGRRQGPNPDLGSMLAQLGPGFNAGDIHAGLSSVVLDFAELLRRAVVPD